MKLRLLEIDKKGNQSPHSPWLILLRPIENVNIDKMRVNWISLVIWIICWNQQWRSCWHWHWMRSRLACHPYYQSKLIIFKSTDYYLLLRRMPLKSLYSIFLCWLNCVYHENLCLNGELTMLYDTMYYRDRLSDTRRDKARIQVTKMWDFY